MITPDTMPLLVIWECRYKDNPRTFKVYWLSRPDDYIYQLTTRCHGKINGDSALSQSETNDISALIQFMKYDKDTHLIYSSTETPTAIPPITTILTPDKCMLQVVHTGQWR